MQIDYLKTFITLAETNNFTATAEKLHIAQSTVSNRIKELESHYNQILFRRTNKKVELTHSGQKLLLQARRIVEIEQNVSEELKANKYTSIVRLGSPHAVYKGFLKTGIMALINTCENTSIHLEIGHTHQLIEQIYDGVIDIALVSYLPQNFRVEVAMEIEEPVVLVRKRKQSDSEMSYVSIEIEALHNVKLLHSDLGHGFDNWLKNKLETPFEYALYIDQIAEVLDYVIHQEGYTFVPKSIAAEYMESGILEVVHLNDVESYILKHYLITKALDRQDKDLAKYIDVLVHFINERLSQPLKRV